MKKRRWILAGAAVLCILCGAVAFVWSRGAERIALPAPETVAVSDLWDPLLARMTAGEDPAAVFGALSPDQRLLAVVQGAAWAEENNALEAMMIFVNDPVLEALDLLTEAQLCRAVGEKGYPDSFRWLLLDYVSTFREREADGPAYNAALKTLAEDPAESELLRTYAARDYRGSDDHRRALLTAVLDQLTDRDFRRMLERDLQRITDFS